MILTTEQLRRTVAAKHKAAEMAKSGQSQPERLALAWDGWTVHRFSREAEGRTDDLIAFFEVWHDEDAPNPLEDWDAMGSIYSLNTRHINYDADALDRLYRLECPRCGHDSYDRVEDRAGLRLLRCWDCETWSVLDRFVTPLDGVPLSYFEHGLCQWAPQGDLDGWPDMHWDGTRLAGVWVPDEHLLQEAEGLTGPERDSQMRLWAGQACETYTLWCNGEVYGFSMRVFKVASLGDEALEDVDDYDTRHALVDDCCGGFYGYEHMAEEMSMELADYGLAIADYAT